MKKAFQEVGSGLLLRMLLRGMVMDGGGGGRGGVYV